MSGKLYIVPTPIGNLGDITFRAVDALKNANKILAEDTRTTGILLNHYEISTPCESFHIHNEMYQTVYVMGDKFNRMSTRNVFREVSWMFRDMYSIWLRYLTPQKHSKNEMI